tara:strand:- start:875 stop:1333 length:459 start_codon:yes stop_codon:yes gene_type:complete
MLSKTLLTFCVFFSSPVFADEPEDSEKPQFTFLDYRQPAPFRGTLFNPRATAELLAMPETLRAEFDIELDFQLETQATEYQFRLDSVNTKYTALSDEYALVVAQKDLEITALQDAINRQSPSNRAWWIAGGAAGGAAITLGIVYAVLSASGK